MKKVVCVNLLTIYLFYFLVSDRKQLIEVKFFQNIPKVSIGVLV